MRVCVCVLLLAGVVWVLRHVCVCGGDDGVRRARARSARTATTNNNRHLELVQALEPADQVVLQVQDLELGAEAAEALDAREAELVQRDLLERREQAVVVLRALRRVRGGAGERPVY